MRTYMLLGFRMRGMLERSIEDAALGQATGVGVHRDTPDPRLKPVAPNEDLAAVAGAYVNRGIVGIGPELGKMRIQHILLEKFTRPFL
jgi:hypothetical protein